MSKRKSKKQDEELQNRVHSLDAIFEETFDEAVNILHWSAPTSAAFHSADTICDLMREAKILIGVK